MVSVYIIGGEDKFENSSSKEICGGPHVTNINVWVILKL
jgi:alanyl-tRNA synthetase